MKKEEGKTMGKSIKRSVWIRVACALAAVLLFSVMITVNIIRIQHRYHLVQLAHQDRQVALNGVLIIISGLGRAGLQQIQHVGPDRQ